jgi:hypothetical protein
MDDMQLVRELVQDMPLPEIDELASARDRLAVVMSGERVGDRRPAQPVRRSRPVRRFMLAAWATAGVAAAIAAVLVLAPDKIGGQVPAANAEAAQVLHHAAAAALTLPDIQPRPDQFVYQKEVNGAESWMSVDGTRDGLGQGAGGVDKNVFPGCRDGRREAMKGDRVVGTESCSPAPAYRPDLPTDADAMLVYLNRNHSGRPGDANAMGKDILVLMEQHYLRPQSRAALFDAAARVPGLRVVRDVTDPAGRPGIEITWSSEGKSGGIVFDAKTFAYLGAWAGRGSSAVLQVAIVNEVGQRP